MTGKLDRISLGGGCFWCTEAVIKNLPGVVTVTPGYGGGNTADPTYKDVCSGATGHAEMVLVEFDTDLVSLEKLLDVFFASHDPTSLNRQGGDVGTQYRSIILYSSDDQRAAIDRYIDEIRDDYETPIVTEVAPLETFYPAEDYHRNYYEKNPRQPYCQLVIAPKVKKVRKRLGDA